jgi:hypothetical protein
MVGLTFVFFEYSISQKWMFILHLHLEKLKMAYVLIKTKNTYKGQKLDMVNVRIYCCERCIRN